MSANMPATMSTAFLKRSSMDNEDTPFDDSSKKRARSNSPTRNPNNNYFDHVNPFKMHRIKQQIDDVAQKIEKSRRSSSGNSSEAPMSFGSAFPDTLVKATPASQVDFGFGVDTSGGAFTFEHRPAYMALDDLPATPPKSGRTSPAPEAPQKKRSKTQKRAETKRRQKLRQLPERQLIQEQLEKEIEERRQAKKLQKKLNAIKNNSIPSPIPADQLLLNPMEVDEPVQMDADVEAWAVRLQDELTDAKADKASLQKTIEFLTAQVKHLQEKINRLTSMNEAALKEVQAVRNAAARILFNRPDVTVEDLRKFWEGTARKKAPSPPAIAGDMDLTY